MRKTIYILLTLLGALSLTIRAQKRVIHIPIQYNYHDFKLKSIDSLYYITTPKYRLAYDDDSLAPALPYISVNILIGHDEYVTSITSTHKETLIDENIKIMPNPTCTTCCTSTVEKQNYIVDYTDRIYPKEIVENIAANTMDGYRYIALHVYPFKYNAESKCLYLIDSLNISLNVSSQDTKADLNIGKNMREIVQSLVINPQEMDVLYARQSAKTRLTQNTSDFDYKYIIVTRDSLKTAFQEFANWKTRKGYRCKILTVEEIGQNYTGKSLPLKIKNALKDYYNGTYHGLKYVLLGGDLEHVPVQYCYSYPDTMPADIFYACFNVMDWDSNNNNIGGESSEPVDLSQDIFVTRIPVRNSIDIATFTHRNLLYEREKNCNNDYNRILMCGAKVVNNYTINGETVSDSQFGGDSIYAANISPYWNGQLTRLYDTGTSFPENSSYDFTGSHLQTELNTGYSFVYVGTHGNKYAWQTEDPYGYWTDDAESVYNELSMNSNGMGTTHIITTACHTNAFDLATSCLSETFLKNPNSGVLTYLGSSRQGWYSRSSMPELGNSDEYNAEYFNNIFSSNATNKFGSLVFQTKNTFKDNTTKRYRYLQYAINPLGDPELPIYTKVPQDFPNADIVYNQGQGTLYIDFNENVGYCLICTSSRYDCGQSFYATSEYSEQMPLSQQGLYDICISKDGYLPKTFTFCNTPYIQNDSFENDVKIYSESINIGSNVTSSRPEGAVIIEKGETEIMLRNGVNIKNDFEVKRGAEFEIIKDTE